MTEDRTPSSEASSQSVLPVLILVVIIVVSAIWITQGSDSHHGDGHGKKAPWENQEDVAHDLNYVEKAVQDPLILATQDEQARGTQHSRTLKEYYKLRAYPGAPPKIPHEVPTTLAQENDCLSCHQKGGYVPKYKAYAPVTPHPEFVSCRQCHVPSTTKKQFVKTDWKSTKAPKIRRAALPGSPPSIPHTLQLRENCLSCHGGPSAVAELKFDHPERVHCRQCHVPATTGDTFNRSQALAKFLNDAEKSSAKKQ